MKKYFVLLLAVGLVGFSAFAQDDEAKDANVLKAEIKALEKVIGDTEKEIVKLEKSVVKTRPESEQAKRDAANIAEMHETKKREAEAFQYDKKKAELKKQKKELKKVSKTQNKLQKKIEQNESAQVRLEQDYEVAKAKQTRNQTQLDGVAIETGAVSRQERKDMDATLKSSEVVDENQMGRAQDYAQKREQQSALEKSQRGIDKEVSKSSKTIDKHREAKAKYTDEKKVIDESQSQLSASVASLEEELNQWNPKTVKKELDKLAKDADAARITHEKLQQDLDQVEAQIKQKHDFMEEKKIEVREKQSALLRK